MRNKCACLTLFVDKDGNAIEYIGPIVKGWPPGKDRDMNHYIRHALSLLRLFSTLKRPIKRDCHLTVEFGLYHPHRLRGDHCMCMVYSV